MNLIVIRSDTPSGLGALGASGTLGARGTNGVGGKSGRVIKTKSEIIREERKRKLDILNNFK